MKRTYARYFNLMRMVYTLLIIVIIDSDPRRENRLAPPLNCPCRVMEQYRPTTGQSLWLEPEIIAFHVLMLRCGIPMELRWINDSLSGHRQVTKCTAY